MLCRFCKEELKDVFIDLVNSPPSNSFLTRQQLNEPEVFFPLKVYTCNNCFLVQVDEYKKSDAIFDDEYVYFSSFSSSWLAHAKKYTEKMIDRFGFSDKSQVIEIASNDGYLLQYFKQKNIPVLGIEPTANTAKVAQEKGIESITEFFGTRLAKKLVDQGRKADLLLGNNVLAQYGSMNTTAVSVFWKLMFTGWAKTGLPSKPATAITVAPLISNSRREVDRLYSLLISGLLP